VLAAKPTVEPAPIKSGIDFELCGSIQPQIITPATICTSKIAKTRTTSKVGTPANNINTPTTSPTVAIGVATE
jgi:hypothetical protein